MKRLRLLLLVILIEACMAGNSCVTKNKCRKLGTKTNVEAGCQPKSQDCEGKRVTGKKYCKDYKSCDCCVPPIECSKGTLRPCEVLNGTCMSQNEVCDGREVTDQTFCKSIDTCKCCFRETPCPCANTSCEAVYQNQTYEGICRSGDCLPEETRADICTNTDCNCCIQVPGCSEEDGFFMINGSSHCFKVFDDQQRNWTDGNSKCVSEGLRLAQPMDVVAITLRKYLVDNGDSGYMWLGAKYDDESQFRWESDDVPISNSNHLWWPGQPYTKSNYCLLLLSHTYELNAHPSKPYFSQACHQTYNDLYVLCELVRD